MIIYTLVKIIDMKYKLDIIINAPITKVVELYSDQSNNKKWQEGCVSATHISGEKGQVGAKTNLVFKMGKRDMTMVETIIETNFPKRYAVQYEAKGAFNTVIAEFDKLDEAKTLLKIENEFKFSGFMKVLGFLMPGAFKKQTLKYMNSFKEFAEKESIV